MVTRETVAEYNHRNLGKAWMIVGITLDGMSYCRFCSADWWAEREGGEYGPNPIFASDDHDGMTCDRCHDEIY